MSDPINTITQNQTPILLAEIAALGACCKIAYFSPEKPLAKN